MSELSHYDETGKVKMVDVSEKEVTTRRAVASCRVLLSRQTIDTLRSHSNPKGDPLEIRTQISHVIIGGRDVGLDNKHEALYRKYIARQ